MAAAHPSLGISFVPYTVALRPPIETAAGRFAQRSGAYAVAAAVGGGGRGVQGLGEVAPWPGFGAGPAAVATWRARPVGPVPPEVRAAVDCARADAAAQAAGLSLAAWWAQASGRSPAATLVSHLPAGGVPEAGRPGAPSVTLKLKVGALSLADDTARVAAVRAAHPQAHLRLDANGAWTPEQAHAALVALAAAAGSTGAAGSTRAEAALTVFEQPLDAAVGPAAWAALRRAARAAGCAIEADESVRDAESLEALIDAEGLDGVVLKPAFLGGFATVRALALRAAQAGLAVCVTHAFDTPVGRLAALHTAAALAAEVPGLTGGFEGGPDGPGAATWASCRLGSGRWRLPAGFGLGLSPAERVSATAVQQAAVQAVTVAPVVVEPAAGVAR